MDDGGDKCSVEEGVVSDKRTSSRLQSASSTATLRRDAKSFAEITQLSEDIISLLPVGSKDLLLPSDAILMEAVGVYEMLRRFAVPLQLAPFRFEDFCAAVASPMISPLLCEMHISLLRLLHKDNEENGVTFTHTDLKSSYDVMFVLALDHLTWPSVLLQFGEGNEWPAKVMDILSADYPYCEYSSRLVIMGWMCELALQSNRASRVFSFADQGFVRPAVQQTGEAHAQLEEHCRACSKRNNLIHCSRCGGAFHRHCVPNDGPVDWECVVCQSCHVKGVTDVNQCIFTEDRECIRLEVTGYDAGLNRYVFAAHRLFVESFSCEGVVLYYSSYNKVLEVEQALLNYPQPNYCHDHLIKRLQSIKKGMRVQMEITLELTIERRIMSNETTSWLELNAKCDDGESGCITKPPSRRTPFNSSASTNASCSKAGEHVNLPQMDGCYSESTDSATFDSDDESMTPALQSGRHSGCNSARQSLDSPTLDMTAIDFSPDSIEDEEVEHAPCPEQPLPLPCTSTGSRNGFLFVPCGLDDCDGDTTLDDNVGITSVCENIEQEATKGWRKPAFSTERRTRTTTGTIKPLAYDLLEKGKLTCPVTGQPREEFSGASIKRGPSEFIITIPHRKFTRYGRTFPSPDAVSGEPTGRTDRRPARRRRFVPRKTACSKTTKAANALAVQLPDRTILAHSENDQKPMGPKGCPINRNQGCCLAKCTYPSIFGRDKIADSLMHKKNLTKDVTRLFKFLGLGSSKELLELLRHNRHEIALISQTALSSITSLCPSENSYYRLGNDHSYLRYVNQYVTHEYSQSKLNCVYNREKKNQMTRKYYVDASIDWSLAELIGVESSSQLNREDLILGKCPLSAGIGDRSHLLRLVCIVMIVLECQISPFSMHRDWHYRRANWAAAVADCSVATDLAQLLLELEGVIKPMIFHPSYMNSLSSAVWQRESAAMREEHKREEASQRRQTDSDMASHSQVNSGGKRIRNVMSKVRSEEYRLLGGGWCWDRCLCTGKALCDASIRAASPSSSDAAMSEQSVISATYSCGVNSIEGDAPCSKQFSKSNEALPGEEVVSFVVKRDGSVNERPVCHLLDGLLKQREAIQTGLQAQLGASLKSLQIRIEQDTGSSASSLPFNRHNWAEPLISTQMYEPLTTDSSVINDLLNAGEILNDGHVLVVYKNETFKLPMCANDPSLPFKLGFYSHLRLESDKGHARNAKQQYVQTSHSSGTMVSLYDIPKCVLYALARKGSKGSVPGFKGSRHPMWLFPFCKPVQQVVWRWRTRSATHLAQVALQLKLLWFSLRQGLLEKTSTSKPICQEVLTDTAITIHDRRDVGSDGLCSEYMVEYKSLDGSSTIKHWLSEYQLPIGAIHEFNYALEMYRLSGRVSDVQTSRVDVCDDSSVATSQNGCQTDGNDVKNTKHCPCELGTREETLRTARFVSGIGDMSSNTGQMLKGQWQKFCSDERLDPTVNDDVLRLKRQAQKGQVKSDEMGSTGQLESCSMRWEQDTDDVGTFSYRGFNDQHSSGISTPASSVTDKKRRGKKSNIIVIRQSRVAKNLFKKTKTALVASSQSKLKGDSQKVEGPPINRKSIELGRPNVTLESLPVSPLLTRAFKIKYNSTADVVPFVMNEPDSVKKQCVASQMAEQMNSVTNSPLRIDQTNHYKGFKAEVGTLSVPPKSPLELYSGSPFLKETMGVPELPKTTVAHPTSSDVPVSSYTKLNIEPISTPVQMVNSQLESKIGRQCPAIPSDLKYRQPAHPPNYGRGITMPQVMPISASLSIASACNRQKLTTLRRSNVKANIESPNIICKF